MTLYWPNFAADPQKLTRFLVECGCEPAQVAAAVHEQHPSVSLEDARALAAVAVDAQRAADTEVDRMIEAEGRAAVDAEHDLSKTMHTEDDA